VSAKIPRHSVIAAWGRLKFRAKVKAQRGAGRQGLLKGFDRLGNSTETKDDFRKSRKPGPEILAFKGAETQQILHARDDCREGSLIQIDVRSCFFPKEKGRSVERASRSHSSQTSFQKFLARVAGQTRLVTSTTRHADAYLFNCARAASGRTRDPHPVAGHDHRGKRAKQEGMVYPNRAVPRPTIAPTRKKISGCCSSRQSANIPERLQSRADQPRWTS
jgi:hypothetical protein